MSYLLKLLITSLFITVVMSGCDSYFNDSENTSSASQQDQKKTIFKYKGALIGNNSAVGGILYNLDISNGKAQSANGFQLFSDKPPYGILINYDWKASEQQYKETSAYYATYFFTLIPNADFVTFNFNPHRYTVSKDLLIEWYGQDFTDIDNEQELLAFLKDNFDTERLDPLFETAKEDERVTRIF